MWLAATTLEVGLPAGLGIIGLASVVFLAMRFNRADAGAAVTQYGEVLRGMRDLNEELDAALNRCRAERAKLEEDLRTTIAEQRMLEARLRRRQDE